MKTNIINTANILSFILLILTILTLPAYGSFIDVSSELEATCYIYNHSCKVEVTDNKHPQAYATRDNKVIFTTGIINMLTDNELKSVGYHEVGHIIFNHYRKADRFFDNFDFQDASEIVEMRYNHEIEADLFSTYIDFKNHQFPKLPTALFKIVGASNLDKTSDTHPKPNDRIKYIYKFYNYLQRINKNETNYTSSYRRFLYSK